MLIPTSEIKDWRDLQDQVCIFFNEMGYSAKTEKEIDLVRGKKFIDVFVEDNLTSHNQKYLIECKFWNKNVEGDIVHAFRTVMVDSGADTGFIISKVGFQPGAIKAAKHTNIQLLTFKSLQQLYSEEWFLKKCAELNKLSNHLAVLANNHFNSFNRTISIYNSYIFTKEHQEQMGLFRRRMANIIASINFEMPENCQSPMPIKIRCNLHHQMNEPDEPYFFESRREYFETVKVYADKCINDFNSFMDQAKNDFEKLDVKKKELIEIENFEKVKEGLSIRSLKKKLTEDEYNNLVSLL